MAASMRGVKRKLLLSELQDDTDVIAAINCVQQYSKQAFLIAEQLSSKEECNPDACVWNFVEEVVPRYTCFQFKGHFRMDPDVFEALCQWLIPHMKPERSMTSEEKILATLWLLANQEAYRSVGDRFGMNRGTLHRVVKEIYQVLVSLRENVIRWPQRQELDRISEEFERTAGLPGVVGAIDGTYIRIKGKADNTRDSYICRKGFPAMHLQVVSDSNLLLLDVDTGNVGSVHDSRVFRNSALHQLLESDDGKLPVQYHLLGDSAYPLKEYLLVPFQDNGHLTHTETKFNLAHAKTRSDVERAIGLLKGKFRRLQDLNMTATEDIPHLIFACCVLHNFIILKNGVDEEDIVLQDEPAGGNDNDNDERARQTAVDKRNEIACSL
ncbi:hypothetical protein BaRGS_00006143 [Batillaria attramentaria]|uniref:Nuclease HARBI1 n=1 Tax=Batillaria attramentaria TaxID=370345 RepID=A0ABD0LSV4_9CAEN